MNNGNVPYSGEYVNPSPVHSYAQGVRPNSTNLQKWLLFCCLVYTSIYTWGMKNETCPQLLEQIAGIQHMEPGKLCIIRTGPQGTYYNLQCREAGRTVTRYVPQDQVEVVAEHTANYQKFKGLVESYAQGIINKTRKERESGSKKKKSTKEYSSPRTKKSKL